ncbi:DnaB-like helicase C-terminal domain-containing protein [Lysinibacillus sp. FSL K6-0232]|uniref:DnaB-like helicase C-terminal domain-containing protein n=1 Tax=Lysinibacillus sp. FSL K6-0232 TaxID=2921425 RepID=UPI0030F4DF95
MQITQMLIEEAKQLVALLPYIERATGKTAIRYGKSTFIKPCPFCDKTSHHFSINEVENYYNSFNGCVPGGSIIDFMIHYENLPKEEAIKKLLDMANLIPNKEEKMMTVTKSKNDAIKIEKVDFTALMEKAHRNVQQTDYFVNRGLTSKTIDKYKLGYADEGFIFAINNHSDILEKENDSSTAYKYFLPIWDNEEKCSYFLTRIDDSLKKDNMHKIHNLKGRQAQLLNERYLQGNDPQYDVIFVVEGYIDALSIEELDFPAIAINSVVNINKFSKLVQDNLNSLQDVTFIIIPDGDEAGDKLIENAHKRLSEIKVHYEIFKLPEGYKDVNEFLVADREGLKQFITDIADKITASKKGDFLINYLEDFLSTVRENKIKPISSHFPSLDNTLGGGFFPGLYVIGGATSVGKTAFVHQIADQVASEGIPVFYFSYEMSRIDLMARSLSRLSLLNDRNSAVSDVEIKTGRALPKVLTLIQKDYHLIVKNMEIYEGRFGENVDSIESKVQRLKRYHDSFLVVVDYLQVVNASKTSLMGERSTVDAVVTRFKQISRDYQVPVIAISSFNRSNYNLPVGFESFKESGAIEYSADVLMGLQFRDIHQLASQKDEQKKREQVERWKKKYPRELVVQILKNRFGDASSQIKFDYFTKHQFFREL